MRSGGISFGSQSVGPESPILQGAPMAVSGLSRSEGALRDLREEGRFVSGEGPFRVVLLLLEAAIP